jgi:hypothetical protein
VFDALSARKQFAQHRSYPKLFARTLVVLKVEGRIDTI